MSDVQDEENDTISQSSDNLDELENGYESNDTDSLNLDDEEEEDEGSSFPIPCLSDRLLAGSLVLHIDQTGTAPGSAPASLRLEANHSPSTTTSLSDTASDGASTRALMGDTPSTTEANAFAPDEEDAADNSSQVSVAESEAERVRRIHNSIFSSLEHDLAELVRIREETIQFLETGVRSGIESVPREGDNMNGDGNFGGGFDENQNFPLRESLTYYTRPFRNGEAPSGNSDVDAAATEQESKPSSFAAMQARSYTPTAKFDNAPPAKPAKPYVEVGLVGCDEKAAAARKILDKLQYGDPEDEGACFVRRFWRETSTVVDTPPTPGLSLDVAAIAQRTASLQASLEEAFDGLRLRLHQVQTDGSASSGQDGQGDASERNRGESDSENTSSNNNTTRENEYYQIWEDETSIINNPLNYDIWNELEEGNEAGPTITARINMAEQRALATSRNRQRSQQNSISTAPTNDLQQPLTTSTVGVGTESNGSCGVEGAELDDDSTDDEEMMSYFRVRCNSLNDDDNSSNNDRPSNLPRALNQESRAFFQEIGISEQMGQDLFNMFTFSDDEVQLPPNIRDAVDANYEMSNSEIPEPLFPRNSYVPHAHVHSDVLDGNNREGEQENNDQTNNVDTDDDDDRSCPSASQIPLTDLTPCIRIAPNREDDCSTMVYIDENFLNFPINRPDESHNQDH